MDTPAPIAQAHAALLVEAELHPLVVRANRVARATRFEELGQVPEMGLVRAVQSHGGRQWLHVGEHFWVGAVCRGLLIFAWPLQPFCRRRWRAQNCGCVGRRLGRAACNGSSVSWRHVVGPPPAERAAGASGCMRKSMRRRRIDVTRSRDVAMVVVSARAAQFLYLVCVVQRFAKRWLHSALRVPPAHAPDRRDGARVRRLPRAVW